VPQRIVDCDQPAGTHELQALLIIEIVVLLVGVDDLRKRFVSSGLSIGAGWSGQAPHQAGELDEIRGVQVESSADAHSPA
jgi:hypothetical protein